MTSKSLFVFLGLLLAVLFFVPQNVFAQAHPNTCPAGSANFEILTPTGDAGFFGGGSWTPSPIWSQVDEYPHDGDASAPRGGASFADGEYAEVRFNHSASGIPIGSTIEEVQVRFYAREEGGSTDANMAPVIEVGGTRSAATALDVISSYILRSHFWTTNPRTGSAWTVGDIDNTKFGAYYSPGSASAGNVRLTTIWMTVCYTPPPTGSFTVGAITPTSVTEGTTTHFRASINVSAASSPVISCNFGVDGSIVGAMVNEATGNSFSISPCTAGSTCTARTEIPYTFPSGSAGSPHTAFARCANSSETKETTPHTPITVTSGASAPVIDPNTLRAVPAFPRQSLDTVRFEATASDADGDVVSILFEVESSPGSGVFNTIGECDSPSATGQSPLSCSQIAGPYGAVGVYKYRAIATDDGGRTDIEEKTFEVIAPPPPGSFSVSSVSPISATENVSQRFSVSVSVSPTAANPVVSCALIIDGTSVGGMNNQRSGRSFASDPCNVGETCTAEIDYTFPIGSAGSHDAYARCANNASPAVEQQGAPVSISVAGSGGGPLPGPIRINFPNPLGATTFTELIGNLIDFLFTIAVIVAPILLVVAGVIFMTAAGEPSRVATARRMLLWTVIGFGIILISKGLVEVLKGILGI